MTWEGERVGAGDWLLVAGGLKLDKALEIAEEIRLLTSFKESPELLLVGVN
jgi:phage gp46-like protein